MKLELIRRLGDGAFADVWCATDELDRELAVKIIRPANAGVADARAHAKALARASHPNVVTVHALEHIVDPEGGAEVECVVMELLQGKTLSETLQGAPLTREEVQKLGLEIVDGLEYIHAQGLAHGDLHEDNVMITDGVAKVIDILYLSTMATLSTEKRSVRIRKDLLGLRLMLQQLIVHSELDSAEATEFNNLLESDASLTDIRLAFVRVLSPLASEIEPRAVDHAFTRLTEEAFVEGEEYAEALDAETPDGVLVPLLRRLVDSNSFDVKRRHYVKLLWSRLGIEDKRELAVLVGETVERELPKGRWWPSIRLLIAFGDEGWNALSPRLRLKIEGLIVKDVLAGHKDIHSPKQVNGGALGTWAIQFWRRFSKKDVLADNLISLLRQNWYTQNYVGEYFIELLEPIAKATNRRGEFIQALRSAVNNDARLIVRKLNLLPNDWVEEIQRED